jgi:hypothetical protein
MGGTALLCVLAVHCRGVTHIDIANCGISALPSHLHRLTSPSVSLVVDGNPLQFPPPAVLSLAWPHCRRFFEEAARELTDCDRCSVVAVGGRDCALLPVLRRLAGDACLRRRSHASAESRDDDAAVDSCALRLHSVSGKSLLLDVTESADAAMQALYLGGAQVVVLTVQLDSDDVKACVDAALSYVCRGSLASDRCCDACVLDRV